MSKYTCVLTSVYVHTEVYIIHLKNIDYIHVQSYYVNIDHIHVQSYNVNIDHIHVQSYNVNIDYIHVFIMLNPFLPELVPQSLYGGSKLYIGR